MAAAGEEFCGYAMPRAQKARKESRGASIIALRV